MKETRKILTKHGIRSVSPKREDEVLYFSMDVKKGQIPIRKMKERFFAQKLSAMEKLFIKNETVFLKSLGIYNEIEKCLHPLLRETYIVLDKDANSFSISKSKMYQKLVWPELDFNISEKTHYSEEEREQIFNNMLPGYRLKKTFEPDEAIEQLKEAANYAINKLGNTINKTRPENLMQDLFDDSVLQMKIALASLEERKQEENKTQKKVGSKK